MATNRWVELALSANLSWLDKEQEREREAKALVLAGKDEVQDRYGNQDDEDDDSELEDDEDDDEDNDDSELEDDQDDEYGDQDDEDGECKGGHCNKNVAASLDQPLLDQPLDMTSMECALGMSPNSLPKELLLGGAWEEEKHPRGHGGKFTSGEATGRAQAASRAATGMPKDNSRLRAGIPDPAYSVGTQANNFEQHIASMHHHEVAAAQHGQMGNIDEQRKHLEAAQAHGVAAAKSGEAETEGKEKPGWVSDSRPEPMPKEKLDAVVKAMDEQGGNVKPAIVAQGKPFNPVEAMTNAKHTKGMSAEQRAAAWSKQGGITKPALSKKHHEYAAHEIGQLKDGAERARATKIYGRVAAAEKGTRYDHGRFQAAVEQHARGEGKPPASKHASGMSKKHFNAFAEEIKTATADPQERAKHAKTFARISGAHNINFNAGKFHKAAGAALSLSSDVLVQDAQRRADQAQQTSEQPNPLLADANRRANR